MVKEEANIRIAPPDSFAYPSLKAVLEIFMTLDELPYMKDPFTPWVYEKEQSVIYRSDKTAKILGASFCD